MNIQLSNFTTLVFDFDGVFTDNRVYVNEKGIESICVSRADGYGINLLAKAKAKKFHDLKYFVLSTEKNMVVSKRCQKMNISYFTGISDKYEFLVKNFSSTNSIGKPSLKEIIYVGNDLNDLKVMQEAGFSFCPNDAHPLIKTVSSFVSKRNGGDDFVREIIEILLNFEGVREGEINELISDS